MYSIKGSDELKCVLITDSTAGWSPNAPTCESNFTYLLIKYKCGYLKNLYTYHIEFYNQIFCKIF